MQKVYTTGEAAKLLYVTSKTVRDWFDHGCIKGFRIPGSRARRIPHDALVAFCAGHGLPTLHFHTPEERDSVACPSNT